MLSNSFLMNCWSHFCAAVNAYCTQARSGGGSINLPPLVIPYEGRDCTVIQCNPDGTCLVDVRGHEETLTLTEQQVSYCFQAIFAPLGLDVKLPSAAAGA